jgi:RNA polymerase sigma-70 factor (ECF subfamily)
MNAETKDHTAEIELIRQIGKGNRAAFASFYEQFAGVIYSTALKVLNDQRDAEDVAQEVFVMIWDKATMYDPSRGKPLTWAVTMTRNKAIDKLRSLQRRFRLKEQVEKEASCDDQLQERAPLQDLEDSERGQIVRSAVMKLSKEQREVIEMAYFSGLTQNEIAEELNEPLGTVKARIRRGMMKLRRLVSSDSD